MLQIRFASLNSKNDSKRPAGLWQLGRWYVQDRASGELVAQGLSYQDACDLVCAVRLMMTESVAASKGK